MAKAFHLCQDTADGIREEGTHVEEKDHMGRQEARDQVKDRAAVCVRICHSKT